MKSFIEIIEEEKKSDKPVVMAFGRTNPPTTGHLKLINKVRELADKHKAKHTVIVSHSQDSKKNPLSGEQKIKHLKRYSPGTHFETSSKEHPTVLHHAAKLHAQGHNHLIMVAGSDRVKEYHHLLHKYNGVKGTHGHYNFKKIEVKSAGHRDPDAEGAEGMSGTKMREHAKNKDFSSFRQGVPSHVSDAHARELMHDVRKGMGLHESVDRGIFKAIFVTGGPGSGKDVVLREAIAESRAIEINLQQAFDYLCDKQKLSEKSNDFRREAVRNRGPLIINGPADPANQLIWVKEELEDLGYQTMMVFVNTTNEVSQDRNSKLSRMMSESVRQDKWVQSQKNKELYSEKFDSFVCIDNSSTVENIEEDITQTYLNINKFIDTKEYGEVATSWLENHGKLNINDRFISLFKEDKNVQKTNRFIQNKTTYRKTGTGFGQPNITPDSRAGDPNADDLKWNGNKKTGGYVFKTYTEETGPILKTRGKDKESNFSKDKEKIKSKRYSDAPTVSQRLRNTAGVGPEFDTRQQGTVYPMSGLGDITYREEYKKVSENKKKQFKYFRKR